MEEVIKQLLIDYNFDNLSDDIFVNLDGTLKNMSGECISEAVEKGIREHCGIDEEAIIYAIFGYTLETEDDQEYIFLSLVGEEGILFNAFNSTDNTKEEALLFLSWEEVRNITYDEAVNPNEDINGYIITNDPITEMYSSFCGQIFHLQDNTYLYISCFYFANYELTNFLNDLFTSCQNFLKENLSEDDLLFLDYLRDNLETSIDESISSLYGITLERANELKQYFK